MSTSTDFADPRATTTLTVQIAAEADLLKVRAVLRSEAKEAGLNLTAATKFVTAGSELARNIFKYATHGQGVATIESTEVNGRRGVRATFRDEGPGIEDMEAAMRDGFSTADSLGLGLPGSRRLVDEFSIESDVGKGTTVTITQWSR
ncbi:ATP-binding protein [Virgisporangium ochraceum]|uniref:Serine/threonine protein kinase n=1 Tax=Virgisporangium ochraceum TaxID=65505 RepID=A0A8J4EGZ7_9ACTN|nr:anti-sigma regulatory factor [Virgisporangium ochraceum]GIJ74188.1 serine/threonine protein kinase [Virgisporangium ochraceum]